MTSGRAGAPPPAVGRSGPLAWTRAALGPFLVGGELRRLYVATLVDAVGLGTYLAMSALYLTQGVGLTNRSAGVALSLAGLASLVGLLPVGVLGDRWGARRVLVLLFAYRALAFAALAVAHDFATVVVGVVAAGVISRATGPLTQALVLDVVGPQASGVEALAVVRALRNAGFALGAAPAAIAVAVGARDAYRGVLFLSVASFLLAALAVRGVSGGRGTPAPGRRRTRMIRDGRFVVLTVASGMLTLHALVLAIGFPLWLVQHTAAPRWLAALLAAVNTVLSVLLQVRFSRGAERLATSRRMLVVSGLLLAAVCILVPVTGRLPALLSGACFVLLVTALTFAELWQSAGSWGYTVALAPEHQRGSYLAFFSLGFTAVTIAGPALITALVDLRLLGWLLLAAWFLVATAIVSMLPARVSSGEPAPA
jgi:MFS family permease